MKRNTQGKWTGGGRMDINNRYGVKKGRFRSSQDEQLVSEGWTGSSLPHTCRCQSPGNDGLKCDEGVPGSGAHAYGLDQGPNFHLHTRSWAFLDCSCAEDLPEGNSKVLICSLLTEPGYKSQTSQRLTLTTGNHYLSCAWIACVIRDFDAILFSPIHFASCFISSSRDFSPAPERERTVRIDMHSLCGKKEATYGAHHVVWVIRSMANVSWMPPDF